jgi:hypothetical protein
MSATERGSVVVAGFTLERVAPFGLVLPSLLGQPILRVSPMLFQVGQVSPTSEVEGRDDRFIRGVVPLFPEHIDTSPTYL